MKQLIQSVRHYLLTAALAGAVTASAQTTTNFSVATAIPDGSTPGLASFKSVSTPITSITNLKVTLKITGTYNGDLYCYLTHGSGFTVLLNLVGRRAGSSFGYSDSGLDVTFDGSAGNGDVHNYRLTLNGSHNTPLAGALTGTWAPDGRTNNPVTVLDTDVPRALLSSFNGLNPNGDWTLFVADLATGDMQTLDSWGLIIQGDTGPSISIQPANQSAECTTGTATFSVSATAPGTLTYQWRFGGSPITGATNASSNITNATFANAGSYDVIVSSGAGSVASTAATLTIVDTTVPGATLSGSATMTVECHTSFSDPGATASDTCAGSLAVSVSGSVNVNTPGTNILTYSATDPSGNTGSTTRTVRVVDTTVPVVTLNGSATITVECHTSFSDPGAIASDTCAGSLAVSVSGSVNVNTPGTNILTYSATDPSGNTGSTTRTVRVVDTALPVVTLNGITTITVECHTSFSDPGATASDTCAGSLAVRVSGSVNVNTPGTNIFTY